FFHALTHLSGGLVGEGHGQNGFRHHAFLLDQIRDAVSDDACLAAPRAGEDQHRPVGGFNGLTLLRIELIEERQQSSPELLSQFYRDEKLMNIATVVDFVILSGAMANAIAESKDPYSAPRIGGSCRDASTVQKIRCANLLLRSA